MLAVNSYNESEKKFSVYKSDYTNRLVDRTEMEKQEKKEQFEELFIPHLDRLYNMALRMTHNSSDAEDLVQETYLKAYRFFDSFENNTNEKAWLITIMMNSFRTKYRKARREPVTVDFDSVEYLAQSDNRQQLNLPANKSENRNLENIAEYMKSVVSDDVLNALENVPLRFRMPVLLSDAEQFNYQEISEILGISVGTVKSRIFRGRRILKRNLYDFAVSRGIIRK